VNLYEIVIRPLSAFGTPLKGDTLFGQLCWQVAQNPSLVDGGLEAALSCYNERPFIVLSSAWPRLTGQKAELAIRYAFKRPDIPMSELFPGMEHQERKDFKRKKWLLSWQGLALDVGSQKNFFNDTEISAQFPIDGPAKTRQAFAIDGSADILHKQQCSRNTINRLTGTTGKAPFAPYSVNALFFRPGIELAVFALVDKQMTSIDNVVKAFENIGRFGFGKDASLGMGRFAVAATHELPLPDCSGASACYTLSPCVPSKGVYSRVCFEPFVRFGRHGDVAALSGKPFKNPVVMADEGAVLWPASKEAFNKPYLGTAVGQISKAQPEAVMQGYAFYLPMRLEAEK
jgi:CRISPR-associated protein Csm4